MCVKLLRMLLRRFLLVHVVEADKDRRCQQKKFLDFAAEPDPVNDSVVEDLFLRLLDNSCLVKEV